MPLVNREREVLRSAPGASVIVPVRNGGRTLRPSLEAIFRSQDAGEFEVIVVDDGSTDSTPAIASDFPCRLITSAVSRGPAAARNQGAAEARSRRLVFVDADVFVKPDTLSLLLSALENSAAAFATYETEPVNRNFATLFYHALSCQSLKDTSAKTPVFYSYCAAIGKDLFDRMGGFDTRFRRATFEDMELGWRLRDQGLLSEHLKNARVDHAVEYNLPRLTRAYFRKSEDLTLLLLSRRNVTFADQGWTHRKNWAALACAWATLGLGPLAVCANPLWAVPWLVAALGFLALSAPVYRAMAERRWFYGPLGVVSYFAVHLIATAAIVSAGVRFLAAKFCGPSVARGRARQAEERLGGGAEGERAL
jgi:glycosyltransferase involved in cell wall biosynthesis